MTDRSARGDLSTEDLAILLEVTRSLAAPFDLMSMLAAVTDAARQVLRAERSSVWLHDAVAGELVLEVSSDMRHVRIPVGLGLVGTCARDRQVLNVPDCYADPRFDQQVDRRSGYRTRCSLTLPLIDHAGALVGVMQVLNRIDGTFQTSDEQLASALAAQCAVALQRVQMIESLIEGEKMRREMEMAQVVQMSTLPQAMPLVAGYDVHGTFRPALLTGGDTFDLAPVGDGLLVVLGDATGHGIAPALSVTQMHAMLRMAFRLGAELETAFAQVNDLLAETLAEDRFVTAFIGVLDPRAHQLRYVSAGQGPILHFHAERGTCSRHKPTSFPLGAMTLARPPRAAEMIVAPGDVLVLLSDGIYECGNGAGEQSGEDRVEEVVAAHHARGMAALSAALLDAVQAFAGGAAQEDDITVVLVRRYREYRSMPGFDIDEIAGRTFVKQTLEWNLPPVVFESLGKPSFHLQSLRPALFASALWADPQDSALRKTYGSLGAQVDMRLSVLYWYDMILSTGFAAGYKGSRHSSNEWMISLKIL